MVTRVVKGMRVRALELAQGQQHTRALLDRAASLGIRHISPRVSGRAIYTTGTGSW